MCNTGLRHPGGAVVPAKEMSEQSILCSATSACRALTVWKSSAMAFEPSNWLIIWAPQANFRKSRFENLHVRIRLAVRSIT